MKRSRRSVLPTSLRTPPVAVGTGTQDQIEAAVAQHFAANSIPQVMAGANSPDIDPKTNQDVYLDADTGDVYTGACWMAMRSGSVLRCKRRAFGSRALTKPRNALHSYDSE
jgi:hypothetical protein